MYILTRGFNLRRRDNGCPIPPAAPRTVTFDSYFPSAIEDRHDLDVQLTSLADAEKALVWRAPVRALRAANMMAGQLDIRDGGGVGWRSSKQSSD